MKDHTERVYGAMIRQLDRRIGDIMKKLKDSGLDENTLVIFTSDNGGAWYTGIKGHNMPYRGYKGTFFEGGIRVPLLMRWPGKIAPATVRNDVAQHLDMFATIAGVAAATMPTERKNLAAMEPKRVAEMLRMLEKHNAEMPKPLWPSLLEGAIRIDVPLNVPWTEDQEYVYWAN
ncbi:MAG: sulfatase-like hydrolase/transferase [Sphingorhabdus sp.]